jgi:hypothetical protein
MQGVRVIGIQRKRLLAAKLGFGIAPGPHVAKTGLTERSYGSHPGRIQVAFGFFGDCPALTAIHQCISVWLHLNK